jgi:hypothetical protein
MKTDNDNTPDEEGRGERDDPTFDFWSDEGARRFNEALDEGGAYARAHGQLTDDLETYIEEEEREYLDPELRDEEEETPSPGDLELIFENSYIG